MTRVELNTRAYFRCPTCGVGEYSIQHLLDDERARDFGPWGCDEEDCRSVVWGHVTADGLVEITRVDEDPPMALMLLKLRDLYLVVGGYRMDHVTDYLVHSHQCPTNMLRAVTRVIDPEHGEDPHGVLRLVAKIESTPKSRKSLEGANLATVLALFGTDGRPLPSEWPEENSGVVPWLAELQREHRKKSGGDA